MDRDPCREALGLLAATLPPLPERPPTRSARAFVVLTMRDTPCGILVEDLRAYSEEHPTMTAGLQSHQIVLHKEEAADFATASAACDAWIEANYGANRIRKALADRTNRVAGSDRDRCMFEGASGVRGRRRGR